MKAQFGLRALLLATAFAAIWSGIAVSFPTLYETFSGHASAPDLFTTALIVVVLSPLWLPFTFIGYASARGELSGRVLLALVIVEGVSIGAMAFVEFKWAL